MLKNFYTTSSDKKHRNYALGIVIWVVFSLVLSYSLFLYKPQLFYFRAWEYCNEVLHPNPEMPQVWDGFEKGDMSRPYFFRFQESHHTRVTIDADGFRIVPYESDRYETLVYGDSQAFGSGVSDDDTFPWQLALKLNLPIFNASRANILTNLLNKPEIQQTKLIVHVVQSAGVSVYDYFPGKLTLGEYDPVRNHVVPVNARRFYLPLRFIRVMRAVGKDLFDVGYLNQYMCGAEYNVQFSETDFDKQLAAITGFSNELRKLNYMYVLVLVPNRCLLYADNTDEFSKEYFPRLIKELEKQGVYAVDLQDVFLNNKEKGLFFHTDTHWNAKGIEIAAEEVAKYLKRKSLVNGFETIKKPIDLYNSQTKEKDEEI